MKQHITIEQLNELSQPARQKLRKYKLGLWAEPLYDARKTGPFAGAVYHAEIPTEDYLFSIGQMIEFLGEDYKYTIITVYGDQERTITEVVPPDKLCDALWEAVKEVLNGK